MRNVRTLQRQWARGDKAKVLKALAPKGQLNERLLSALLDGYRDDMAKVLKLAHAVLS